MYDYGARFYSPGLGRFLSADTLVPEAGWPQAFNRYSYALNNPVRYTDPSGHWYYDPGLDAVVHQHGVNYNERPQYLYPIQTPQTSVYAKPQPQNLPSPAPVPAAAGPLLPYAATPGPGLGWPLGPYNSQPQSFPPQLKGHETVIEPSNGPSRPLGWQPQIARRPHLYLDLRKVNWVDVTISGAGLVGEAAKFCGIEGMVVYGLTEIAEVGGGINDLYTFASAAENGKTFSTFILWGKWE